MKQPNKVKGAKLAAAEWRAPELCVDVEVGSFDLEEEPPVATLVGTVAVKTINSGVPVTTATAEVNVEASDKPNMFVQVASPPLAL